MEVNLIDKHVLVPKSRSSVKVMIKYQGHVHRKKNGHLGGISVSQTHLLFKSNKRQEESYLLHSRLYVFIYKKKKIMLIYVVKDKQSKENFIYKFNTY